ncbi:MAG: hypothetical protein D6820_07520 [Lentisphaerae bacterium]|nr:MAG: hypothetical protein D6820_07520 [Lentisphaerota bacterium]
MILNRDHFASGFIQRYPQDDAKRFELSSQFFLAMIGKRHGAIGFLEKANGPIGSRGYPLFG